MQEQAAGRPVVKIEAAAGKGGLGGQAVGAAGALKKCFIAGHGTGQGELGKEVVVLFTQAEHQRQFSDCRHAAVPASTAALFSRAANSTA